MEFMKKLLIITLLALAICLVGCEGKKVEEEPITEPEVVESGNAAEEVVNGITNKSFEERIAEAVAFMNQEDEYGIDKLGHCSKEHFVTNAKLEKKDDYYVMKLEISRSKIFERSEIEKLASEAKEFDANSMFQADDPEQKAALAESYERRRNDPSCVFIDGLVEYQITPNDSTKCCADDMQFAGGFDGFMITEVEKEIEVVLLPDDIILICPTSVGELLRSDDETLGDRYIGTKEMKVSRFYELAEMKAIASDDADYSIYGFYYDLDKIGDCAGQYAEYVNAVEFLDGMVVVNYKNGGV